MTSKYSLWMLSKQDLFVPCRRIFIGRYIEQLFKIATYLGGERVPTTIRNILTDLIVEGAIFLRPLLDKPQHVF